MNEQRTWPQGVARKAVFLLATLCGLLGLAQPAGALTPSRTTVMPATGTAGHGMVITVLVSGTGGTPSGKVTINFGDGSPSVVVPLGGGTAITPHIYVAVGNFPVTAAYGGDGTFAPSNGVGTVSTQFYPPR